MQEEIRRIATAAQWPEELLNHQLHDGSRKWKKPPKEESVWAIKHEVVHRLTDLYPDGSVDKKLLKKEMTRAARENVRSTVSSF